MEYVIILPNGEVREVRLESQKEADLAGSNLLAAIFSSMGLAKSEQQYFGLSYCNKEDGRMDWLEKDDNLKNLPKSRSARFHLAVRYYPQHPDVVLKDGSTRSLFCLQIKEKLLRGELGCDVETHACLDGLLVQAIMGDFNPSFHKPGYLRSIKGVELVTPSRLNSDADPAERIYLRRVGYYHKSNIGVSSSEAELLYLKKAKNLCSYGYIIHTVSDRNKSEICVGLEEGGIAIFDDPAFAQCEPLMVKTQFSWDHLKYCISAKCKVKLGVELQKGKVTEFVWKVKSKNCFRGAKRLCMDITAFREMFASRDENDFLTKKKEIRRVKSFRSPSSVKSTSAFRRLNSVTSTIRNSLRRKLSSKDRDNIETPKSKERKGSDNVFEDSGVGLLS